MAEARAAQSAPDPARRVMGLRVLSVAFPFAPVSADPVGGAEQVLAQIDRHLVERGHESVVIAPAGSSVHGQLVAVPLPAGEWNDAARVRQNACVRAAMAVALAHGRCDVVHCHGVDFAAYLPPPGIPLLATLHLPLDRYPPAALRPMRPLTFLQPVSREQCRGAPPDIELLAPVDNGVAENPFACRVRKRDVALALGRICPEKRFEDAVSAARGAGIELRIAGAVFPWPEHLRYAREVLSPMLDARRRWVGVLRGLRKQCWLARARCVLLTSRARETSSLVAMEALAAGTPVIAYPSGAIAELIDDGVTGFLVDGPESMADAIRRVGEIDPRACLHAAHERCRLADTLDAYLALYGRLIEQTREAPDQVLSTVFSRAKGLDEGAASSHRMAALPANRKVSPLTPALSPNDEAVGGEGERRPRARAARGGMSSDRVIDVLPDLDALRAHEAPWFSLWRTLPDATPFQSPAWLLCWARHYAADRTGAVVVRAGDELLALLPYFSWNGSVWLAGTGPSDYGDALIAERAGPHADAMLDALAGIARARGCDRIDLRQLRSRSRLLAAATPCGWRSGIAPGEPCASLRLHGERGLGAATAHCRRNIRCASRRLDRAGAWSAQRVPADEAEAAADTLLGLHERRWSARGEPSGLFADARLRGFVRDVIPRLAGAGLLRMYALKLGPRPLAATFAMHAPGATHFYGTGFDPDAARFSPGLLSIVAAIAGAAAEGDGRLHFLRGRESYKFRLGASEQATWRRVLHRR